MFKVQGSWDKVHDTQIKIQNFKNNSNPSKFKVILIRKALEEQNTFKHENRHCLLSYLWR